MTSPFLLEDIYNSYEGSYDFSISSALFPSLSLVELLAFYDESTRLKVLESWLSLKLEYSEQFGLRALRELIASSLQVPLPSLQAQSSSLQVPLPSLRAQRSNPLTADQILITSGASEAIYIVFKTLCEKYSDPVFIVQKPIYQSLYQVAADHGARIIDWDCDAALSAKENISKLETIVNESSNLTGLVLNNPNNPLGTLIPDSGLELIANLLEQRRVQGDPALLIVDEVFRASSLVPVSTALEFDAASIVISDMSKAYSLPGLRIGYIASRDTNLLAACSSLKNYLSLRSSTLSELIACSALEHAEAITSRNRKIAATNLETLVEQGIELDIHPDYIAGPVLFPRLRLKVNDEKCFVLNGSVFGSDYSDRIRMGLGLEPGELKRVLALVIASPEGEAIHDSRALLKY